MGMLSNCPPKKNTLAARAAFQTGCDKACNKDNFTSLSDFINFAHVYLEFIKDNLQAVIVSRNENHYQFFQYKQDASFNVTRPINSRLMYRLEEFEQCSREFLNILKNVKDSESVINREIINRTIYCTQQCIGATLDALPANKSNIARKINGDLFERFIRLVISEVGIDVSQETISVPVIIDDEIAFNMNYQHDLIIKNNAKTKAIGSVKTSSKDRLDKIFIDKFLYNKLTEAKKIKKAVLLFLRCNKKLN